jgi:hypothetical protein
MGLAACWATCRGARGSKVWGKKGLQYSFTGYIHSVLSVIKQGFLQDHGINARAPPHLPPHAPSHAVAHTTKALAGSVSVILCTGPCAVPLGCTGRVSVGGWAGSYRYL